MQIVYTLTQRKLEVSGHDWTVFYYSEWDEYLFNKGPEATVELENIINFSKKHGLKLEYRQDIEVRTVKYLLGVYPTERKIYLGSHHLSNEMTLMRRLQSTYSSNPSFEAMKSHINHIAAIPVENSPPVIDQTTFEYGLTSFDSDYYPAVHKRSAQLMDQLVEKVGEYNTSLFERFSDFGLDMTAS